MVDYHYIGSKKIFLFLIIIALTIKSKLLFKNIYITSVSPYRPSSFSVSNSLPPLTPFHNCMHKSIRGGIVAITKTLY